MSGRSKPAGPKDATVANPPSSEASENEHEDDRTPGLGDAVPGSTEGKQR